jgi:hypothetical protein
MMNKSLGLTLSLSLTALACGDDASDQRAVDAAVQTPSSPSTIADAGAHHGHVDALDAQAAVAPDASSAASDASAPSSAAQNASDGGAASGADAGARDAAVDTGVTPDAASPSALTKIDDPSVAVHTCAGDTCPKGQCTLLAEPMFRCEQLYAGALPTLDYCPAGSRGARYCLVTCTKATDSVFCDPFPLRTQEYVVDCTGEAVSISPCQRGETCQVEAEATCQPALMSTP